MEALEHFSIPIEGLEDGIHQKMFSIDKTFFEHFENAPIKQGDFEVKLVLDKRSDLIQMDFDIAGNFDTLCDRCMAEIDFPIETNNQLLVKYADVEDVDANVMYITRDTHHVNISKFLYDSICLSVPLTKVYACRDTEPYPCDETIIEKLETMGENIDDIEADEEKNSVWDSLKGLNLSNN